MTPFHYHLTVKSLTNNGTAVKVEPDYMFGTYADLYIFPSFCEFTEGDFEVEMSEMTPITLNKDGTFNGLLIIPKNMGSSETKWLEKPYFKLVVDQSLKK